MCRMEWKLLKDGMHALCNCKNCKPGEQRFKKWIFQKDLGKWTRLKSHNATLRALKKRKEQCKEDSSATSATIDEVLVHQQRQALLEPEQNHQHHDDHARLKTWLAENEDVSVIA